MLISLVFFLLLSPQQDASIPLALPVPPAYETIIKIRCLRNYFVIAIKNDGFVSRLSSATSNNKSVEFRSEDAELAHVLTEMHSVAIVPGQCGDDGNIGVFLHGVDMRKSSKDFGKETDIPFRSVTN